MKAAIEALRAQGAPRLDPVRFRLIEAMARRAAGHEGDIRRLLDDKLQRLLAACELHVATARVAAAARPAAVPAPSALADLLAHLARQAAPALPPGSGHGAAPVAAAPLELKALHHFRSTWSRLRVDQRLTQSRSNVPEQAGPLNTQRLLHQALLVMRDASPEYLHHFMQQVEALLWLDQARLGPVAPKRAAATAGAPRRR